jgi:trans-2,3-dihydro-3-hydroxyanthranilate isomerase
MPPGKLLTGMSRTYPFVHVDVFTDRRFGGNQLAVFLEPEGLSDAEMQAIAGELNLAETTFVFPSTLPECVARVRIFTPTTELPFAGHPTVGTAWVLASRGRSPAGSRSFSLEEGIGAVPVRLEGDAASPSTVWMAHRDVEWGSPVPRRSEVAAALGLDASDLLHDQPIVSGSTGVRFLYVPLCTPQAVDRAEPDWRALAAAAGELLNTFVCAPDPDRGSGRVYSRMFAGATLGIHEDSATGSASGPLGAYVAERNVVALSDPIEIVSLQGNKMGRPSLIRIRLRLEAGHATAIQVGGSVVPVLEGVLTL